MTRTKINPDALADCINDHLANDTRTALDSVNGLLDDYDMPGQVVRNLQGAQRELRRAYGSLMAAKAAAEANAEVF